MLLMDPDGTMSELMEESMDSFIQHILQEHNTKYITPSAGKLAEGFLFLVEKMWKAVKCCWYYRDAVEPPAEGRWCYGIHNPISCFGYGECNWLAYIRKWLDRNDKDS